MGKRKRQGWLHLRVAWGQPQGQSASLHTYNVEIPHELGGLTPDLCICRGICILLTHSYIHLSFILEIQYVLMEYVGICFVQNWINAEGSRKKRKHVAAPLQSSNSQV